MFTIKVFKILKMFKYNTKFIRAACWINSKISYKDKNTTLMIFLFCKYCLPLLWCNYWRSLMLWNFASWSRLKLTVQIQLAFYLCDPFSVNNRNIAGNSVEKCFVVLNVKLEVKLRFKKVLLTLKPVTYCFRLEHHYQTGLFCSKFLYILATSMYFTDRNWISKTVYSFVVKKVYHSFFGGSDRVLPLKTLHPFWSSPFLP